MTVSDKQPDNFADYDERQKVVDALTKDFDQSWDEALIKLKQYASYESEDLSRDLYALVWRIGTMLEEPQKRQQFVKFLLDETVKGTPFLQGQALKFLKDFEPTDFNVQSVGVLESLTWSDEYGDEVIRLIGIANVRTKIPELEKLAGTKWQELEPVAFYASQQWAAALALARMGDAASTSRIIQKVQSEPDIVVRATQLFQDLAYTKQSAAFDSLKFYLQSKKRLPQLKETVPGMLEAIYAASMFAQYVEGCPVQGSDVNESEFEIIRDWAENQTEWKIK